jgi:general stress protein 26
MLEALDRLIESARLGVLATVDAHGRPRMRWMTPATVDGRPGYLYSLTVPDFEKSVHLGENSALEWMLQSRDLREVLFVRGRGLIVDEPGLRDEVREALGPELGILWRVDRDPAEMVVLETAIEELELYTPMTGQTASVRVEAAGR